MVNYLKKVIKKNFPNLSMSIRYFRDIQRVHDKPSNSSLGFRFAGNESMMNGYFEPEETAIVKKLLLNIDIFVNVGANIGYYSCIALNTQKYVVAFEPDYANTRILLNNVTANNWKSSIEIYPVALSNSVGVAKLNGGGTGASLVKGWAGADDNYVSLVPLTTLDNVLNLRFQGKKLLLLIDIEGSELMMLQGAMSIITMNPKPIWIVEITFSEHWPEGVKFNPNLRSTFDIFWSNGYDSWTIESNPRIVYPYEIEKIIDTGEDTVHSRNFLFIEKGIQLDFIVDSNNLSDF